MTGFLTRLTVAVLLTASAAAPALAQPSSAALARELAATLAARHLDAFAARDPQAPDGFVAALLYPDVQLLVVGARYPAPVVLRQQLEQRRFRDVYLALQSNPIPESKLFVQDMQADGLRAAASQTTDIVYEQVVNQTVLNGNPKDAEYRRTLDRKDEAYSRLLRVLLDAARTGPDVSSVSPPAQALR